MAIRYLPYAAAGRDWNLDVVDINLGYVALYEGDIPHAARLFHGTLLNYRKRGETDDTCLILAAIAGLAGCASTTAGDRAMVVEAARLLGGVAGRLDAIGFSLDPADQMVFDHSRETVRAWLGNAEFEAAWFTGRAMTLAQTLDAAMKTIMRWDRVAV